MTDEPITLLDKNGRHLRQGDTLRTRLVGSGQNLEGKASWEDGKWWVDAGRYSWAVFDISASEILDK